MHSITRALAPERLSAAAAAVAAELRDTARALIDAGAWTGVEALPRPAS